MSREAMNMGSRSSTVISEFKSVIASLGQATDSAFQKLTSARAQVTGGAGGGGGASGTLVAPNPVFNNAPALTQLTETGHGLVASGGPAAGQSSNIVARGPSNLSAYAAQTGGATLYQPEIGSGGGGGAGGGGSRGSGFFSNGFFSGKGGAAGGSTANPTATLSALPLIGGALSGAYSMYNTSANLTPSTSDVLESQLLQQRASFYTGGYSKTPVAGGQKLGGEGGIQATQLDIARTAMLSGDNPQMDVMRAQIAAQGYGLTGPSGNAILKSAANVSNLMPGLGVEGSVRATGAMQQGRSVNMLRGIGIQLRGVDGTMKGPDEVIEEVWKKLCRDYSQAYGASKSPSLKEVQISLQPGNALDSMLNQYFGSDPMLKQLVANGLIFKAQGGGAITKKEVMDLGGNTGAMDSYSTTAAAGQGFLVAGQAGAESGFTDANKQITGFYSKAKEMAALVIQKALGDTLLTAFGGNPLTALIGVGTGNNAIAPDKLAGLLNLTDPKGVLSSGASIFGDLLGVPGFLQSLKDLIPFLADGGPVTSGSPYIVGEEGPELFVPASNGAVVPNNKLSTGGSYTYNITVNAASGSTQDLVSEIKNVLSQIELSRRVSEV